MADRNASIALSLVNNTGGAFSAISGDVGALIARLREASITAGQTEAQFLALAGALSQEALAAGDAARAEQILADANRGLAASSQEAAAAANTNSIAGAGVAASAKDFTGALGGLQAGLGNLAIAYVALGAAKKTVDFAEEGANAQLLAQRFDQVARAAGTTSGAFLDVLRSASHGEIADSALELDVMKARLLGVGQSAQQIAPLLELARDRAQQMGLTTEQAFERLVTGLGRGSAKILDDLGIVVRVSEVNERYAASIGKTVNQLTEEERKQALVNEAQRQAAASSAQTGGAVDGNAASFQRAGATLSNFKDFLAGVAATGLRPMADSITQMGERTEQFLSIFQGVREVSGVFVDLKAQAAAAAAEQARLAQQAQFAGGAMDEERQKAAALQVATGLAATDIQRSAEASIKDAAQKNVQQQATALLNAQTQQAIDAFLKLNPTLDVSAAVAAAAAAGFDKDTQALIGAAVQADNYTQALARLTLQANLAAGAQGNVNGAGRSLGGGPQIGGGLGGGASALGDQLFGQNNALRSSQFQLQLASTKDHQKRIGIYQQELALTTDQIAKNNILAQIEGEKQAIEAEKLRGAKAHTSELNKQLNLNEGIRDSLEKQYAAQLSARKLAAEDVLDRIKEDKQIREAQTILNDPRKARFQEAAKARLEIVDVDRQQRALELAEKNATAGGTIVNGRILQSIQRSGAPTVGPIPLPGGAQTPTIGPVPLPGGTAAAGAGIEVNVYLDSEPIAARVTTRLRGGLRQHNTAGGTP